MGTLEFGRKWQWVWVDTSEWDMLKNWAYFLYFRDFYSGNGGGAILILLTQENMQFQQWLHTQLIQVILNKSLEVNISMEDIERAKSLQDLYTFCCILINYEFYTLWMFKSNNITNHYCPSKFDKLFPRPPSSSSTTPEISMEIFTGWTKTKKSVDIYSGTCYKAFNNKEDVNNFLIMKLGNQLDEVIELYTSVNNNKTVIQVSYKNAAQLTYHNRLYADCQSTRISNQHLCGD